MKRIGIALLLFGTACAAATYRRPLERVASMDPIHASAVYDSRAVSLVYEPLLEVDYEARPYRLKSGACDLPEVSTNRLVYTYRLRDGVRFQDDPCFPDGKGREATAEDKCPGVIVSKETAEEIEGLVPPEHIAVTGSAGDLSAMAANLYEALRSFDDKAATVLFAETVEEAGLGVAVMNRLKKAAGGRIRFYN